VYSFLAGLAAVPPLALLLVACAPATLVQQHVRRFRAVVVGTAAAALLAAILLAVAVFARGSVEEAYVRSSWPVPLSWGVYVDRLSAVMLVLISFVGTIICRFAVRYLDGEPSQGRFFRALAATLAAVLVMVVSRNLVMFTAAWMATSLGLHLLLTHYPERPWAIWAARKKFLISRLGDLFLVAALMLTYRIFGSFEYSELFPAAAKLATSGEADSLWLTLLGLLFVLGAMTKSAQFPFHSWLPDTMETPTPVSALMHAGIINAGGFLILRLSPLVSLAPLALDLLALVGAFTALFGGIVMLTQSSVKRSLAWSTVAQMGFMMLQCGLGAYVAALLHIVAHSLYKAHAFLRSGSVLATSPGNAYPTPQAPAGMALWGRLVLALVLALSCCGAAAAVAGLDFFSKPGGLVLGLIFVVAVTQLLWTGLVSGSTAVAINSGCAAVGITAAYVATYALLNQVLKDHFVSAPQSYSPFDFLALVLVGTGFVVVFALQAIATWFPRTSLMQTLHVHALNGFYLDVPARRLTAWVWGRRSPVP
jgi:NAD(P)H-quinone oxidoreductase subunit 5